jgi:hypothetical protein
MGTIEPADVLLRTGRNDRRPGWRTTRPKWESRTARVALGEPYEVEDFHQKHTHLSHEQAKQIIRESGGDREKADAAAQKAR